MSELIKLDRAQAEMAARIRELCLKRILKDPKFTQEDLASMREDMDLLPWALEGALADQGLTRRAMADLASRQGLDPASVPFPIKQLPASDGEMSYPIRIPFPNLRALAPLMLWTQAGPGADPESALPAPMALERLDQIEACSPITALLSAMEGTLAQDFARREARISEAADQARLAGMRAAQASDHPGTDHAASEGEAARLSAEERIREELVLVPGSKEADMDRNALILIQQYFAIEGRPEACAEAVQLLREIPSWEKGIRFPDLRRRVLDFLTERKARSVLPLMTLEALDQASPEALVPEAALPQELARMKAERKGSEYKARIAAAELNRSLPQAPSPLPPEDIVPL